MRFFESLPSEGTFLPLSTFLGFLMSEPTDKKPVSAPEVVPMISQDHGGQTGWSQLL